MAALFSVTFERWDDAALEAGDTDDRGFVLRDVTLREAINDGLEVRYPSWLNPPEPSDSDIEGARWLSFDDWNHGTREHIEQGISEGRDLHIPDCVTPSSRRRIARLFRVRGA